MPMPKTTVLQVHELILKQTGTESEEELCDPAEVPTSRKLNM